MVEADLIIRTEEARDRAAIHEVHRLAFGREAEAELVDELRDSLAFIPALSILAERSGEVVAHLLLSRIQIAGESSTVSALVLAPVAVLPSAQNQGIGSMLIRAALERARALGERIVVLVGHPQYYPRFGFGSARARRLESPFPVSDAAFMVLELVNGALKDVSGTVIYPAAFDRVT